MLQTNESPLTALRVVAERGSDAAMHRAAKIDRAADLLLSLGHHAPAERLAHLAAGLREAAQ